MRFKRSRRRAVAGAMLGSQLADVIDQHLGHLFGREHIIDQAGVDRVSGHLVECGRAGFLDHHHPAGQLDFLDARGAVTSRAREHDADRPLFPIVGQRAEENIEGRLPAARFRQDTSGGAGPRSSSESDWAE